MDSRAFFYARDVDGTDSVILDCYQLAEHFGQDPDVFLNKPLSKIKRHMRWIAKLAVRKTEMEAEE